MKRNEFLNSGDMMLHLNQTMHRINNCFLC